MSVTSNSVTLEEQISSDPLSCKEFGYGLGPATGILILKYRSDGPLEFGESRQDFLHQLYWSPDGVLSTRSGSNVQFIGPNRAFWAERAVSHEVQAASRQTIYRVCLREVPAGLTNLRVGAACISQEASSLLRHLAMPGRDEDEALADRIRFMAGLQPVPAFGTDPVGIENAPGRNGAGPASHVAHALTQDPADPTPLDEWAVQLHTSVKTLQRDFLREFGKSFTQWRNELRLQLSQVLLHSLPVTEVAHRVGYSSPSAFVSAFAKHFGYTPGRHTTRHV